MAKDSVRVMLTGDNVVFSTHPRPTACYEEVAPTFRKADIRFGNLEWPITKDLALDPAKDAAFKAMRAAATHTKNSFAGAHMEPGAMDAFRLAGYDVVGLANNHHMDFGIAGSQQTMSLLDAAGIAHCGAGRNIEEARRPAVVERNGVRIAFVSFTALFMKNTAAGPDLHGMSTIKVHTTYKPSLRYDEQPGTPMETITTADAEQKEALLNSVRQAKSVADFVVCSAHWGVSRAKLDEPLLRARAGYQTELGRACIDAGADLIVGHHPHLLQGVECYKQGIICYSIGNFVFARGTGVPAGFPPETVIADCTFRKGRPLELSFWPVMVGADDVPRVVDLKHGGEEVLKELQAASASFDTHFDYSDGLIRVQRAGTDAR